MNVVKLPLERVKSVKKDKSFSEEDFIMLILLSSAELQLQLC